MTMIREVGLESTLEHHKKTFLGGSLTEFLKHMVPIYGDIKFWRRLHEPDVRERGIDRSNRAAHFFAATNLKYVTIGAFGYALVKTFYN